MGCLVESGSIQKPRDASPCASEIWLCYKHIFASVLKLIKSFLSFHFNLLYIHIQMVYVLFSLIEEKNNQPTKIFEVMLGI